MSLTIASMLAESAIRYADNTAVVLGDLKLTYAQLWTHAKQYAAVLREKGVGPGDRVALLLPNTPHFPLAYFGTIALGAVAVPVHALLKAEEIEFVLLAFRTFRQKLPTPKLLADEQIRTIKAPTLLLLGADSRIVDADDVAERARRLLSDVTVEITAGAGHGLMLQHTEQVTRRILAFIAEHDARTPATRNVGEPLMRP